MQHEESLIQRQCVAWFRVQYPHLATLLYHIPNEGSTSKKAIGGIRKAEGLMAGAPDLMLSVPAINHTCFIGWYSLAIEMKTAKGKQSPSQRRFQKYFEAAGNKYVIARSFEQFQEEVTNYVRDIPYETDVVLHQVYEEQQQEELDAARKKLQRLAK